MKLQLLGSRYYLLSLGSTLFIYDCETGTERSVILDSDILQVAPAPGTSLCLLTTVSKRLCVCDCGHSGHIDAESRLYKKATKLLLVPTPASYRPFFGDSETVALVSDKVGEVSAISFPSLAQQHPLLGHCASIITDMTLCGHSRLLATADRDEKIKISNLEHPTIIQCFCLGHSEYISHLLSLGGDSRLLSSSGDGTLIFWDCESGEALHRLPLSRWIPPAICQRPLAKFILAVRQACFAVVVVHKRLLIFSLEGELSAERELPESPLDCQTLTDDTFLLLFRTAQPSLLQFRVASGDPLPSLLLPIDLSQFLEQHKEETDFDAEYSKEKLEVRYDPLPGPEVTTTLTPK